MIRLFQYMAPLKLLVLLLLANPFNAYPQQIVLERVSIEPTDSLRIVFNIEEGEFIGIEDLYLRFYPNINDPNDHSNYPIDINNGFDQIIFWGEDAAHTGQLHFRLFAIFDQGGASRSKIHSTIFLRSIESLSEACDFSINALWSNYAVYDSFDNVIQDPPIFDKVQVLISGFDTSEGRCMLVDEITLQEFDQALGDSEELIDLSSISNIVPNGRYCFRVRSIKDTTDVYSYSNIWQDVVIEDLVRPEKVQIRSVDVIDNEAIEVSVEVDSYGFSFFEYRLERSDDIDGSYELISNASHGGSELIFFDYDISQFTDNPWYYRVVADLEDCPMPFPLRSETVSSINLKPEVRFQGGPGNLVEIELGWVHFDIDGGYEYSLIEELQQDQERVIYSSTNQQDTHTETIDLTQLAADVKFFVRATHPSLGYPIHSNHFIFSPERLKSLPNAFRPNSNINANKIFSPEFYYDSDITNYQLSIYDRNGLRVFQTSSFGEDEGWDGIIQKTGQPAPEGAYIYEISFDQAEKPTRGVVYLVR